MKLIVVTGMSGSGKSTTAQNIAKIYSKAGIPYKWYHEEMEDHPIRWANGGEFKAAELNTKEGMQKNIEDLFARWENFVQNIQIEGGTHIMEGCLYQNIIRYFFTGGYPNHLVLEFYDQLMEKLAPVNPHIIFLCSSNVKATLQNAFKTRGENWEKLIMTPDGEAYFDEKPYVDDNSIYQMWEDYRDLSNLAFERFKGEKLKLDIQNTEDEWQGHLEKVAGFLQLPLHIEAYVSLSSTEKYCGSLYDSKGQKTRLKVYRDSSGLWFSTSWFKSIKMHPTSSNSFELAAFPITLTYDFSGNTPNVTIGGNYGWDLNGQTFYVKGVDR